MRPSPDDTAPTHTPSTTATRPKPASFSTSSSSSASNDQHTPPSSTQPQRPSSSSNSRTLALATRLRSLPYKKIALYLRLLILALVFVTLILDAITLSFEVNVMNLDLDEVSTQAALLLTPDVLAMILFLVLLIYPMRSCFSRQYDAPIEDILDEGHDIHPSVSETSLGPDNRSRSSSRQGRRSNRSHRISRSSRSSRGSSDRSQDRYHEPRSERKQGKQRAVESVGEQEHHGLGLEVPEIRSPWHPYEYQCMELTRNVPTITITMAQTPSPSLSSQPQSAAFAVSSPSSRSSSPLSLEKPGLDTIQEIQKVEQEQYTQDDRKKKRRLYTFVGLRIFFALALVALALYWPASGRKAPMGYLPKGDMNKQHRESLWQEGRGGPSSSLSKPSIALSSPAVSPTISANINSNSGNSSASEPEFRSFMSARTNKSYGQGNNNNNRNASAHWCSIEESYGDNQSAFVYCQVKHIRPAMVYFWASLVIIELGMAYMAGELSRMQDREAIPDQKHKLDPEATPYQKHNPDPEKHDYGSSKHDDPGAGVGGLDVSIQRSVLGT